MDDGGNVHRVEELKRELKALLREAVEERDAPKARPPANDNSAVGKGNWKPRK